MAFITSRRMGSILTMILLLTFGGMIYTNLQMKEKEPPFLRKQPLKQDVEHQHEPEDEYVKPTERHTERPPEPQVQY